jgi:hypothetical protein
MIDSSVAGLLSSAYHRMPQQLVSSRYSGAQMDYFRRFTFTFLFAAPVFDADDLEGLRFNQIIAEIERSGFEVVRARKLEDAEIAVQTDAAIGCMVVDWGKGILLRTARGGGTVPTSVCGGPAGCVCCSGLPRHWLRFSVSSALSSG